MDEFIHTNRVTQRSLSAFTALTELYNCHQDFKIQPSQDKIDALTQAASNFQNKIDMLQKCLAMSVTEILGIEGDDSVEGESQVTGVKL